MSEDSYTDDLVGKANKIIAGKENSVDSVINSIDSDMKRIAQQRAMNDACDDAVDRTNKNRLRPRK